MDALIVNRKSFSETDRATLASGAVDFGRGAIRELPLADGTHGPHDPADPCVNFYTPQRASSFDNVAIGESVALMDGNWARVFLRYALSLAKPGGRLLIARNPASARGVHGFLSSAMIDAFLSPWAKRLHKLPLERDARLLVFEKGDALPEPPQSMLSSFLDDHDSWVEGIVAHYLSGAAADERGRAQQSRYSLDGAPFLIGSDAIFSSRPSKETIAAELRDLGSEERALARYVASVHAYLVDGLRYKSTILAHVARTCVAKCGNLAIADVGSGYGLVPMELCLEDRPSIAKALIVEMCYSYTIGVSKLFEIFGNTLDRRVKFALSSAETFTFDQPYDIVSYIGSLLYVDRAALGQTLEKAWDALAVGGALVVHENIQNRSYSRDHDVMFTAGEIDERLGRFGNIRYFLSTGAVEVAREKAANKTVFRVVTKGR
jgi:SAM-dependent methyltransferase